MSENRKHPRKQVSASVAWHREGDSERIEATCRDLSLGGMFIETPEPAVFGAQIKVYLTLPGLKEPAAVSAIVRWTTPEGMGVQFGVMGARETHALTGLLG